MKKSIYDLKLHETISLSECGFTNVKRVPNGWIYTTQFTPSELDGRRRIYYDPVINSIFVPYHKEFHPDHYKPEENDKTKD